MALGTDPTIVRDKKRINNLSLLLKDIDEIEWRKVFLYASDERILDVLISGINRLQMDIPITDVSDIERYASDYNYPNGALDGQKLLSRNPLTKSKLNDVFESKNEREKSIIVQLLNFKYEIEHQIAPMSHLADIYQIIRFSDVDEDKLKEAAHSMGIQEFSQRLMAVLQDTLGLTEGFMPFIAKNDKVAQELTQAITKFNTY